MKKSKYTGLFLVVAFVFVAFLGSSIEAQTQQEMNKDACDAYNDSDREMNILIGFLKDEHKAYKDDKVFIASLEKAQRAWTAYRDAYADSMFPEKNKQAAYGSAYQMCRCNELKKITDQRIQDLKRWQDGVEEGDVCSGSIKTTMDPPDDDTVSYAGSLQRGKTDSVILYFGEESGDYAAFCFANKSDVGMSILSACKDGQQCEFTGKLTDSKCVVPGLEADLSASGRIVSVKSVKSVP